MVVSKGTKCVQCGRELRKIPFGLKYMLCKDCYEAPRQARRGAAVLMDVETTLLERQMGREAEL
ncbi:MAG: hypothetical protein NZT92_01540 [Abditibacteriales bacterium]|nr:hypothetical protein [Abditibacteriales bacterium]MDW8364595.1 hypothetical protein [Abditibacteriales bacterium]